MFVQAKTKYLDCYLIWLHFKFSTAIDCVQPLAALCTAKLQWQKPKAVLSTVNLFAVYTPNVISNQPRRTGFSITPSHILLVKKLTEYLLKLG